MPSPTLSPHLTAHPIQRLYWSIFKQATQRRWFIEVLDMDGIVQHLIKSFGYAELPTTDLVARRRLIAETIEQSTEPMDYFDLVRTLRHCFHRIPGSPAGLVSKAVISVCAAHWPVFLTPETLQLAKGLGMHLADGVAPRDLSELNLSCLMLRPRIVPGVQVVHVASGRYGQVISAPSENGIIWEPFHAGSAGEEIEGDPYALIPITPILRGIPLMPESPFPRVSVSAVETEFRAFYPFGNS